jgi:hypothetical protein
MSRTDEGGVVRAYGTFLDQMLQAPQPKGTRSNVLYHIRKNIKSSIWLRLNGF